MRPEEWAIISEQLWQLTIALEQLEQHQREVIALYMQGQVTFNMDFQSKSVQSDKILIV